MSFSRLRSICSKESGKKIKLILWNKIKFIINLQRHCFSGSWKKKRGENLKQWTACWEGREKKMRKGDRLFGQSLQRGRWKSWMKRVSGGHSSKTTFSPVFFPWFSSRFGRKNLVGPGEKFFSRVLHPLYFPPYAKQWKTHFSTPFSLLYFLLLLKSIQPNTPLGFFVIK